ncbi:MAG TPA: DUF1345 domain-containing protein [Acidimicrobiales bacterium]|nr:DUF1345 domain-containing protein [Acidimicrobiales bacterium]
MRLRRARTRLLISAIIGAVVWVAVGLAAPWQVAALAAWNVAAAVMVAWVLSALLPLDGTGTATIATREDNSRVLADVLLVGASVASLVGVGFALLKSNDMGSSTGAALTGLAVVTVVLSWTVVHTVYMLHYARLFYGAGRGVEFNGGEPPDYRDFAYLAFTIGMTYQVSDTDLTTKSMRRTATHHALLSYLFGTVVVAMTINVVASLVK